MNSVRPIERNFDDCLVILKISIVRSFFIEPVLEVWEKYYSFKNTSIPIIWVVLVSTLIQTFALSLVMRSSWYSQLSRSCYRHDGQNCLWLLLLVVTLCFNLHVIIVFCLCFGVAESYSLRLIRISEIASDEEIRPTMLWLYLVHIFGVNFTALLNSHLQLILKASTDIVLPIHVLLQRIVYLSRYYEDFPGQLF